MINSITLENFRGFKSFQTDLKPITLFGGKNNSGKTSILEAVMFLFAHNDPNCFFQMNFLRHMNDQPLLTPERLWGALFYNFDTNRQLKILLQNNDGSTNRLTLKKDDTSTSLNIDNAESIKKSFVQMGGINANYPLLFQYASRNVKEDGRYIINNNGVSIKHNYQKAFQEPVWTPVYMFKSETMFDANFIAEWFGQLTLDDRKKYIIEALKAFDKAIVDVQTIVKGIIGYLYVIMEDGRKIPLAYMGDGINRLLIVLLGILSNPNSIILIDEIENGFHYSMYEKIWKMLGQAAIENNCQIIANTHSKDMIHGAVEGLKEADLQDKFSYIRLGKIDDKVQAHVFDMNLLDYALNSEMEVR